MAVNFSSEVLYFHLGMKSLTKAHWCKRLFQPPWLQITLRRLVYTVALGGKCFVLCQDKQKMEKKNSLPSLLPLFCPSHTFQVQNEFADIHMLYVCQRHSGWHFPQGWCDVFFPCKTLVLKQGSDCVIEGIVGERFKSCKN